MFGKSRDMEILFVLFGDVPSVQQEVNKKIGAILSHPFLYILADFVGKCVWIAAEEFTKKDTILEDSEIKFRIWIDEAKNNYMSV